MRYDNFLFRLYKDSPTERRYQAQVLVPDTADGGRLDLPLTPPDLDYLREQSAAVMGYEDLGETYRRGLGYSNMHSAVQELARQLHTKLPLEIQQQISVSLTRALHHRRGLRIGLLIDPSAAELASLPWEILWDPQWSGGYLAQSPAVSVVRLMATSFPPSYWPVSGEGPATRSNNGNYFTLALAPEAQTPRHVLVALVGATEGLQVAGAFDEATAICRALQPQTQVKLLPPPLTLADLEAELSAQSYQVLHIITHGHADSSSGLAHLLFDRSTASEDDRTPEPDKVIAARLLGVLQGRVGLELIVLSSCRSAAALQPRHLAAELVSIPSVADSGSFLTTSLGGQVAGGTGIPVLAMQFDILAPAELLADDPTHSWAGAFYGQLALGTGVDEALTAARRILTVDKDPLLWAAPTLFVPFYWIPQPVALYERVDRRIYGAIATAMAGNGRLLHEGLLIVGLLLLAAPIMGGLLAPPADPADRADVLRMALSLFLTIALLPVVLSGCVVVLTARERPALRKLRGHPALSTLLTAYAGAGLGVLTVIFVLSLPALILYFVGRTHPLIVALLDPLLQLTAISGVVLQGMVYAGRAVRVGRSVADESQIYNIAPLVGCSPLIMGSVLALSLPLWYEWLLAGPEILIVIGMGIIGCALWLLRQPPKARG